MKKNMLASLIQTIGASAVCWSGGGEGRGRDFDLDQVTGPRSARGGIVMPVTFDGGTFSGPRSHIFGKILGQEYRPFWHTYFNDFDVYAAADWTITDTGGGGAGTSALVTGLEGGGLQVKNDNAGINELRSHQLVKASYLNVAAAGKPMAFSARIKVNDATKGLFAVGMQSVNANPYAPPADGVWFLKGSAANTHIDFKVSSTAAGLATVADVAEAADDTFIILEFAYDGDGNIHYGVNGAELGTVGLANAPLAVAIAPVFSVKNGEAVAKLITLDWLYVTKKR